MTIFTWNGTNLGVITDDNIKEKKKFNKFEYWLLSLGGNMKSTDEKTKDEKLNNESNECEEFDEEFEKILNEEGQSLKESPYETQWVLVYSATTFDSLIIDEIKPIFKIRSLGTHKIKYKNRYFTIVKANTDKSGELVQDISLREYVNEGNPITDVFIFQVQETYVFRELLGISQSNDSNIVVRNGSPVSLIERRINPYHGKVLPGSVLSRWFDQTDVTLVVKRFLSVSDVNSVPALAFRLHGEIERVINRVNRHSIFYVSFIIDRISRRLTYNFNVPSPKSGEDSSEELSGSEEE